MVIAGIIIWCAVDGHVGKKSPTEERGMVDEGGNGR